MIVRISSWPSIFTRLAFSTLRSLPRRARIAWTLESRPCLAEPPAESPSTRNSSVSSLDLLRQSASLPGRLLPSRLFLRRVSSRALRAASRASAASMPFSKIDLGFLRVFLEVTAPSFSFTADCDEPFDLDVQQLVLRLAFELRLGDLDADDGDQALARSSPLGRTSLSQPVLLGVAVDRAGQRGLEAAEVRAAVVVVDVVGEGEDRLVVAVVVLQRDLDHRAAGRALPS